MAYDYIIVGGGPAGCVLANRLSADPSIKVLLLEAGGGDSNPLFRMPAGFARMTKGVASWGWSTVPQKHLGGRVIRYTQAKIIGGGSTINAQLYTRGNAKDYDAWVSHAGCDGWSYRETLPLTSRRLSPRRWNRRKFAASNWMSSASACTSSLRKTSFRSRSASAARTRG